MRINTLSNKEVTNQIISNDDNIETQHYIVKKGTYDHLIEASTDEKNLIEASYGSVPMTPNLLRVLFDELQELGRFMRMKTLRRSSGSSTH